jgi:tetratricopeptide (TPR) repeat protein
VIAAGWAVDDQAANLFARKFYEEMFRNRPFGDAVKLARQEIFAQYGASNTWGAYQCYGDPDYAFKADPNSLRNEDRMVAPAELLVALQGVARKAKTAKAKDEKWLRQKLDALKADADQAWMESAAICAAFGKAYGELGQFEEAVRFYDKGKALQPADATVESLEQLANLKVRWALKQALEVVPTTKTKEKTTEQKSFIEELINDAESILDSLIKIQPTQGRYALKGKIYKGKAILGKGTDPGKKALQKMQEWYGKGYDFGKKGNRNDVYYPLANRLAAEIMLSWDSPKAWGARKGKTKESDPIKKGLAELETCAEALREKGQSFWDWSLKPDCLLGKALYEQRIAPERFNDILKGYQEAKRREGSARQMDSVVENIRFFEVMLGSKNLSKVRSPLAESLRELRESLEPRGKTTES